MRRPHHNACHPAASIALPQCGQRPTPRPAQLVGEAGGDDGGGEGDDPHAADGDHPVAISVPVTVSAPAILTGAGRRIGRAIAEGLADAGAEVLVHYHTSKAPAEEAVAAIQQRGGQAWSLGADLTDPAAVRTFFDAVRRRWPHLDILVNNTGDLVRRSVLTETDDALIEQVYRLNVYSAMYASRAAVPLMLPRQDRAPGSASIVNLTSVAAHNGGAGGAAIYASSKGAILTRGLAKELARAIRVNGIAPGVHLTDFHRRHSTEERLKGMAASTAMARLGTADDCTAAAIFLCGDGASFGDGRNDRGERGVVVCVRPALTPSPGTLRSPRSGG